MVDIEQFNPHNQAALRAWWEVGQRATAERPGTAWPAWDVTRTALPAPNPEADVAVVAAIDGREMVGAGLVSLPSVANTSTAQLDTYVVPERRRQGIGSAVLAELERIAVGARRTSLLSETFLTPQGAGSGLDFATQHGYAVANRESIKQLAVDDYRGRRAGLIEEVEDKAADYDIVTFDTVCPAEYLSSFGELLSSAYDDVPLGDLDVAGSEWDDSRLRAAERRNLDIGRHVLTALAIAPGGSVAGSSDARVSEAEPETAHVGLTVVSRGHRGRRLGLALKLATHDLALASCPQLTTIETSNAESNTPMNEVNERLGYRTIETLVELQRRVI